MRSSDLSVVPLERIPETPYATPSSDLPRLYSVAKSMERLCSDLGGLGLAAAQVGLPWRLFVARYDYPDRDDFGIFFDCSYQPRGTSMFPSVEGCLSLPGKQYKVERHESVIVSGKRILENEEGFYSEDFSLPFSGIASVLMQHEIDHDHGRERMIDSIGLPVSLAWH